MKTSHLMGLGGACVLAISAAVAFILIPRAHADDDGPTSDHGVVVVSTEDALQKALGGGDTLTKAQVDTLNRTGGQQAGQ